MRSHVCAVMGTSEFPGSNAQPSVRKSSVKLALKSATACAHSAKCILISIISTESSKTLLCLSLDFHVGSVKRRAKTPNQSIL